MGQQCLPPGFRFHPTDEEIVMQYLRKKVLQSTCYDWVIGEVDLYKLEPWDLPEKSILHNVDPEWYFFCARDKKYPHGSRTNRATGAGFWKATGKDRKVISRGRMVGMKKTLVFYKGRAPNGERTDWIMHEYRLDEEFERKSKNASCFVLCRIRKKSGLGPRNGDRYGAAVLDEDEESVWPIGDIMLDAANHTLPVICEDETQNECLDNFNPVLTGSLDTSSHVNTGMDFEEIERLSSGDMESFLQSLISSDPQNADVISGPESHVVWDSSSKLGPGEDQMKSADHFTALQEGAALNCIEDAFSFETGQLPTTETLSEKPSVMDLGVYSLDRFHNFVHPAPNEAEMLREIFLTVGGQTETSIDWRVAHETGLASDDYFELADLDQDENFLTMPELDMDGTSQNMETIIGDRDTLQQVQAFDTVIRQSTSSEVPILSSGDLKDNGDGSSVTVSSGFGLDLCSHSLKLQSGMKLNDISLSEPTSLDTIPKYEQEKLQLFQPERFTVMKSQADDGDVVASLEILSAGQALDAFQCKAAARVAVSSCANLSPEGAYKSLESLSPTNDFKSKVVASQGSPSSSPPSLPQIPEFLLKILHLLGDAPILPASAAEMSLSQGPVKFCQKDTLASECVSRYGTKTGTVAFAAATVTSCCSKAEGGNFRAALSLGFSPIATSIELTGRANSNLLEGTKHFEGMSLSPWKFYPSASPNNRIWINRETALTDHRDVWKRLFNGLTVFFFWGTTSVLIFFCLLRGFCKQTKSALTIFSLENPI